MGILQRSGCTLPSCSAIYTLCVPSRHTPSIPTFYRGDVTGVDHQRVGLGTAGGGGRKGRGGGGRALGSAVGVIKGNVMGDPSLWRTAALLPGDGTERTARHHQSRGLGDEKDTSHLAELGSRDPGSKQPASSMTTRGRKWEKCSVRDCIGSRTGVSRVSVHRSAGRCLVPRQSLA